MSLRSTARRWTYLMHRWLGIGGCLLMLLWFVSGMVMLFIGYPKLTPWERLGALPPLAGATDWRGLEVLPDAVRANPGSVVLTTVRGEPVYVVRSGEQTGAWSARSGQANEPVSGAQAREAAARFAGAPARGVAALVDEDRWTHSRGLNPHRPLYRVEVGGVHPGSVYVSSRTGEVVLDAPLMQQRWNYVGAWLHWLYVLRMQPTDPVWTWTVIVLSALCTMAAISGITVGIWRWRFRGRYRSGARTPYTEPWMRWHHLLGLMASAFVFTWIFSGLMSMNPLGMFSSAHAAMDEARYREQAALADGGAGGCAVLAGTSTAVTTPTAVLGALSKEGFTPVEIQWRRVAGCVFAVAMDGTGDTRIVGGQDGRLQVARHVSEAWLRSAVPAMVDAPLGAFRVLHAPDAYFYPRAPEAMNGALVRRFPVAAVDFEDAEATRVYVDLATGDPLLTLGRRERVGRWLFNFLHSWDLAPLLRLDATRLSGLLVLSLAGTALCATAMVIGWRRLRRKVGMRGHRPQGRTRARSGPPR